MFDHTALDRLRQQTERLVAKAALINLETAELRRSSDALLRDCDDIHGEIMRLAERIRALRQKPGVETSKRGNP
jgi:hypothetical protein